MRNILHVEADIKGQRRVPAYTVTQNDSVRLVVTVLDGGETVNLDASTTYTLASTRRDGAVVTTVGTQTGPNEISFDLGTTEIAVIGKVDAVVQLYTEDGRVSTIKFAFTVVKDPTGDGYVPSEKEQTLIEVVLGYGPLAIKQAQEAAASAEVAAAYVDEKKPLIDKFTDEQTALQAQLDEVARGATNVETSQARVDEKGVSHPTLKARLDAEKTAVTSQLAEIGTTPWTDVFSSLDMRENIPIVIAQASDSTGDAANEYFELAWKKCFADIWKERPVRVQRWYDGGSGGSYQGWETWQTGVIPAFTKTDKVYADDFSNDSPSIIGTLSPDVGIEYSEFASHGSYWSVTGGKLTRGGADDGIRATLRSLWNSRITKDFLFTGKVNVPSAASNVSGEVLVSSDTEAVARVGINISGNGVAILSKYFNAVSTTLGTFPAGAYNGVEIPFEISLTGKTLTAKLAGNTLTSELTQAEVDILATKTKTVVRSQIPSTKFDDFVVTATVTVPEQPASVPQVSVYNGGAAGKTAEYQRANLQAMYPVRPDLLFINHGHNYSPVNGWDTQKMLASIQSFVDELNGLYPSGKPIPIVVTSQNPQFGSGRESDHIAKMKALKSYADRRGWGYIPTFEAFAVRIDGGADQMLDALHPGIGTGRVLQADEAEKWIKSQTKRPIN